MKRIITFNKNLGEKLICAKDFPLLLFRLVLAYGLYKPAITKLKDINSIAGWFDSIGIPFPTINAYLATFTEVLGFIFLALGFATRLISIPLIIVMFVAITMVHWANGFEAGNNGFEIPLYYALMLFALFIYGPGKFSLDALIKNRT